MGLVYLEDRMLGILLTFPLEEDKLCERSMHVFRRELHIECHCPEQNRLEVKRHRYPAQRPSSD